MKKTTKGHQRRSPKGETPQTRRNTELAEINTELTNQGATATAALADTAATDTAQTEFKGRVRRQPRRVRPHPSGAWTICIGKALNKRKTKLRAKDWYFPNTTEADANTEAGRINQRWDFLCAHWARLYRDRLELLGSSFAAVPHWQPELTIQEPTEAEISELQNQPPTAEEIAEAYVDATLRAVFGLYKLQQEMDVTVGEKQNVTRGALLKNIRNGLRFFPDPVKVTDITADLVQRTKAAMLTAGLGRRTVKNYLGGIRSMLLWFYDSEYGRTHEKPPRFDAAFAVPHAIRTDIKTHGAPELKAMLGAATERTRLFAMLALNCGMYQSDIGRLTLDEINLKEGYIFWDREKEPQNPFRVRHDLWPETLALVGKFIQKPVGEPRLFADFRKGKAEQIDCSKLAFVDRNGLPLYRVRENGDSYDKISDAWKDLKEKHETAPRFKDIRKSTNQRICELVAGQLGGDDPHRLEAVGEISKEFLAQKTPTLSRLYLQSGMSLYDRMNRFLRLVGEEFRRVRVFA